MSFVNFVVGFAKSQPRKSQNEPQLTINNREIINEELN